MYEGAKRGEYNGTFNSFQKWHHGWGAQLATSTFLILDIIFKHSTGGTVDIDHRSAQRSGSKSGTLRERVAPDIFHLQASMTAQIVEDTLGLLGPSTIVHIAGFGHILEFGTYNASMNFKQMWLVQSYLSLPLLWKMPSSWQVGREDWVIFFNIAFSINRATSIRKTRYSWPYTPISAYWEELFGALELRGRIRNCALLFGRFVSLTSSLCLGTPIVRKQAPGRASGLPTTQDILWDSDYTIGAVFSLVDGGLVGVPL